MLRELVAFPRSLHRRPRRDGFGEPMLIRHVQLFAIAPVLLSLGVGGCAKSSNPRANGTCVQSANPALECGVYGSGDAAVETGLIGYSCTGSARPDDDPGYVDGVPQGLVCIDRGVLDDNTQGYCCTSYSTSCAYNPVAICSEPSPTYGFQCRGSDRPEAFNSLLFCGQGVTEGDFINYCCSSNDNWGGNVLGQNSGCIPYGNQKACDNRKLGFLCAGKT